MEKEKIGIGFQLGHLTVIGKTDQRKNGYMVWECQCDCGSKVCLDTRALQRGTKKDCGCITKISAGIRDITGQKFGKLTALEATGQRDSAGSVIWRSRCDCGNEVYSSSRHMIVGYKKSCGCLGRPPLKKLIGKRFGQLTVIHYEGKQNGMHRWRCQCDCGNETIVGQTLLQSGKTKSCGCLKVSVYKKNLKLIDGTSITLLEASGRRLISSNTSGYTGVYRDKRSRKWCAQITFKGKTYFLGRYNTIKEAVAVRKKSQQIHKEFIEQYYNTAKFE